jgi:hypothetical protein
MAALEGGNPLPPRCEGEWKDEAKGLEGGCLLPRRRQGIGALQGELQDGTRVLEGGNPLAPPGWKRDSELKPLRFILVE